jgi:multimeric flavodoxin WrbA
MGKVVLLSGSPNPEGYSVQILREVAETLEKEGVETEVVSLSGFYGHNVRQAPGLGEGLSSVSAKIEAAQGLIIASPVCWKSVRADTDAILKRIAAASQASGGSLAQKIGGPIVIRKGCEHAKALQDFFDFYFSNGMIVAGSSYWNPTPRDVKEAKEEKDGIRHLVNNVAYLIKALERK